MAKSSLASLDEIEARFGRESEVRRVQMESLRWLADLARPAGLKRLVINGSFVTDVLEPNNVDCVLLIGPGFPDDQAAEAELLSGLPFLDLSLVRELSMRSLKRLINQLKEEIARFESRSSLGSDSK